MNCALALFANQIGSKIGKAAYKHVILLEGAESVQFLHNIVLREVTFSILHFVHTAA